MPDEIWQWSAVQTADAIRNGLISSREAVASTLQRIEEVNPVVNALAEVLSDDALAAADQADTLRMSGAPLGPLHGVPVTTKINSDQAGRATTNGVGAFRDAVVEVDAPHIENLRAAGAVFVGRSNTPSFSIRWFTDNQLHGRTFNPWDRERTPGGSSGGAAAATASGMGTIAHGNDIGGSIRYPAAACGVVGLRPTPGRVPHWYGPWDTDMLLGTQLMEVEGPIARSVADVELGLRAMAAPNPRDPSYVPAPLQGLPQGPRRAAVLRDVGVAALDPAVDAAITTAAGWLHDAGYEVEEVELPLFAEAWRLWWQLVQGVEFEDLGRLIEQHGDDAIRKSADLQFAVTKRMHSDFSLDAYVRGYGRRGTLMRALQLFLQDFQVLLTPISAERTFEIDADVQDVDRMEQVINAQWPMMSLAFLGFPGLSVPVTLGNGLPIGVQLVGQKFREDVLLQAGRVIEARNDVPSPITPAFSAATETARL
ncbi:amidase family protein [Georgenia sp. EYE_87]|uniref:amidase family protein n=1 Tax=Georgenia sp. EYE_87 TaxID=2853448 RepID=UPI00200427D6|nr:amidase family protein [Georgenia sp. EYE_87]MCK6211379.1 amidase family protein [Georgenia sp. EYE_87]